MALRIPLSDDQAVHGFERLLVVGLRSGDAAGSTRAVVDLLEAQQYTNGCRCLPQNTATNNTEARPSGFSSSDRDADAAVRTELGPPLIGDMPWPPEDRLDGHWLAWALGIPSHAFQHVQYADATGQRDARRVNRQLGLQDTPWVRRLVTGGDTGALSEFVRHHFAAYVVARGPFRPPRR